MLFITFEKKSSHVREREREKERERERGGERKEEKEKERKEERKEEGELELKRIEGWRRVGMGGKVELDRDLFA